MRIWCHLKISSNSNRRSLEYTCVKGTKIRWAQDSFDIETFSAKWQGFKKIRNVTLGWIESAHLAKASYRNVLLIKLNLKNTGKEII